MFISLTLSIFHLCRNAPLLFQKLHPTVKSNFKQILNILFQPFLLPSGEKVKSGKTLVIESVDRHEEGTYTCEAQNGVGKQKVEATIKLQVLCE